ncbi:hypothetical protein PV768_19165 [Pseudarthrobacter sp. CC4]|uniref:hypothetical protein n=1 Tax=Pseudarthrobacter sp. CC4 TaxID=3029190 RepID=UPI003B8C86AA
MWAKARKLAGSPYLAQLISLGGSAALTFFSALILAPSERGLVAIFLAIISVGSYLACFGVQSEILQCSARGDSISARLIIRGHLLPQAAFAVVAAVLLIAVKPFPDFPDALGILSALGIFGGSLFNNLSWRQYGNGQYFLSTSLRGLVPLVTLFASFMLYLFSSLSAIAVASIYIALQFICCIFVVDFSKFAHGGVTVREMLRVYNQSLSFFFSQAQSLVLSRTPVIASGIWLPPAITAAISIALSLAELQSSLPQMRSAISFKEASSARRPRLTNKQLLSAIKALWPGTVLVIIISFIARELLSEAYRDLPLLVGLLSLGVAVQALAASAINVLTARRSLGVAIGIQLFVICAAFASLANFSEGRISLGLGLWSAGVALGCLGVIALAMKHKRGRHL